MSSPIVLDAYRPARCQKPQTPGATRVGVEPGEAGDRPERGPRLARMLPIRAAAKGDQWTVRILGATDEGAWARLVHTHPMSRAVYPMWCEQASWNSQRIGLFAGDELIGGLVLGIRRIDWLPVALSRITQVMVGPERHAAMLKTLLRFVERICLRRMILETEVDVRIPANLAGYEWSDDLLSVFRSAGYRMLNKLDRTYVVSIDRDDDALLASFGQQPRNRIRKAMKSGSKVACSTDPTLLDPLYTAMLGTVDRKGMRGMSRQLVVDGMRALVARGDALIFTESYDEVLSNLILVDPLGLPCAMIAARTADNVAGTVPSCAQSVHFAIMKAMRDRGKKYYDMGGCEGPVPIEGHPNFGVWHFKYAFKGQYVEFIPQLRRVRGEVPRRLLNAIHRYRGDAIEADL